MRLGGRFAASPSQFGGASLRGKQAAASTIVERIARL